MAGKLQFTREAKLGAPEGDRIPVVVSTEYPVDRGDFVEVLSHDPRHVDLQRAPLPAIVAHDNRQLPVGVIEGLAVDPAERVLRGWLKPGTSTRAKEISADIVAGVIRSVSVGYTLLRQISRTGSVATFAWRPHEVSVLAVPADPGAGFYRSEGRIEMSDTTTPQVPDKLAETAEAKRSKGIADLARAYSKYLRTNDAVDAIAQGLDVEQFKSVIMSRMQEGSGSPGMTLDLDRREQQEYSIGRAIAAAITGDWEKAGLERECSRALEKRFGMAPQGFFLPSNAWGKRDFNVGTATEAGNLVATDLRGDLFVDALRAQLVASTLGMRVLSGLSGNLAIPRKSSASTIGTLTEIGSASETQPAIAQVTLTPKRAGAYIEYSRQALIQSSLPLENMLRDDLLQSAAVLIESGMINGSGTAPQMTGLRFTTGMGTSTAGANGAVLAWSHLLGLETTCANANAGATANAGYLFNSKTVASAKATIRGTNMAYIIDGDLSPPVNGVWRVNGLRAAVSNLLPSNLTKGTSTTVCSAALYSSDWSLAVLGLFGAPDVVVDPYTLAATGQIRITLNVFSDFCFRQPSALVKIEDIITG